MYFIYVDWIHICIYICICIVTYINNISGTIVQNLNSLQFRIIYLCRFKTVFVAAFEHATTFNLLLIFVLSRCPRSPTENEYNFCMNL